MKIYILDIIMMIYTCINNMDNGDQFRNNVISLKPLGVREVERLNNNWKYS